MSYMFDLLLLAMGAYVLFAGITGAEEEIGIGTYTLNTDMDYHALIAGMHSSSQVPRSAQSSAVSSPSIRPPGKHTSPGWRRRVRARTSYSTDSSPFRSTRGTSTA